VLEDFEKKTTIQRETISRDKKVAQYIYSKSSLISLLQHFTKGKDLARPAVTRLATSYLTLACLMENKGALIRMFISNQWTSSKFAKIVDGKQIEEVVMDSYCYLLERCRPINQSSSDRKNQLWDLSLRQWTKPKRKFKLMPIQFKEGSLSVHLFFVLMLFYNSTLAFMFCSAVFDAVLLFCCPHFLFLFRSILLFQLYLLFLYFSFKPMWDIIDDRWDKQMHRPLHAASYYLNPKLHYGVDFKAYFKVKRGLYDYLERMTGDVKEISKTSETAEQNIKTSAEI
jgi:hypothetical protein